MNHVNELCRGVGEAGIMAKFYQDLKEFRYSYSRTVDQLLELLKGMAEGVIQTDRQVEHWKREARCFEERLRVAQERLLNQERFIYLQEGLKNDHHKLT